MTMQSGIISRLFAVLLSAAPLSSCISTPDCPLCVGTTVDLTQLGEKPQSDVDIAKAEYERDVDIYVECIVEERDDCIKPEASNYNLKEPLTAPRPDAQSDQPDQSPVDSLQPF